MSSSRHGIDSSARRQAPGIAIAARVDDQRVYATLADGREVSIALPGWLRAAPPAARGQPRVEDFGTAIYFEDLDEDIGVNELLGITEDELYEYAGYQDTDLRPGDSRAGPPVPR